MEMALVARCYQQPGRARRQIAHRSHRPRRANPAQEQRLRHV